MKETRKQLLEYFEMKRKSFDIPLLMLGTEFQKSVWNALLKKHWNTIIINGEMKDKILAGMIDDSYNLVVSKLTKKEKSILALKT